MSQKITAVQKLIRKLQVLEADMKKSHFHSKDKKCY